jgi:hypothetical protein
MPGTTELGLNAAADAVADLITHARAFDGDPNGGGVAVSAEVAVAFDPAAATVAALADPVDFAIGAGDEVNHIAFITGADALVTSFAVTPEVFAGAGTYRLTAANIDASVG